MSTLWTHPSSTVAQVTKVQCLYALHENSAPLEAKDVLTSLRADELLVPLGIDKVEGAVPIPNEIGAFLAHSLMRQEPGSPKTSPLKIFYFIEIVFFLWPSFKASPFCRCSWTWSADTNLMTIKHMDQSSAKMKKKKNYNPLLR